MIVDVLAWPTSASLLAALFPAGDLRLFGATLGGPFDELLARMGEAELNHAWGSEDDAPSLHATAYDTAGKTAEINFIFHGEQACASVVGELVAAIAERGSRMATRVEGTPAEVTEWRFEVEGRPHVLSVESYLEAGMPVVALGLASSHHYVDPSVGTTVSEVFEHLATNQPEVLEQILTRHRR